MFIQLENIQILTPYYMGSNSDISTRYIVGIPFNKARGSFEGASAL